MKFRWEAKLYDLFAFAASLFSLQKITRINTDDYSVLQNVERFECFSFAVESLKSFRNLSLKKLPRTLIVGISCFAVWQLELLLQAT